MTHIRAHERKHERGPGSRSGPRQVRPCRVLDYTSRDPQVARLRERLAAEYDGRPAIPAGMDAGRFMGSSRLAVRTLFERMASHGLLADPDGLYAAMFPFPDMPCIGDLIVMDALSAGLRGAESADGRRTA